MKRDEKRYCHEIVLHVVKQHRARNYPNGVHQKGTPDVSHVRAKNEKSIENDGKVYFACNTLHAMLDAAKTTPLRMRLCFLHASVLF